MPSYNDTYNDTDLQPKVEPTISATLITLASKAIEEFAREFAKSLGKAIGEGIVKTFLKLLGIDNSFSLEDIKRLLSEYADYIIREVRLAIKEHSLAEYYHSLQGYAQTLIEYHASNEHSDTILETLQININDKLTQIYALADTNLRSACLGAFIFGSIIKLDIHTSLISNRIAHGKNTDGQKKALYEGINFINSRLENLTTILQDDFDKKVVGPIPTTTVINCGIRRPPKVKLSDDIFSPTFIDFDTKSVPAIHLKIANINLDHVERKVDCRGTTNPEITKYINLAEEYRLKNQTEFETKFLNPSNELMACTFNLIETVNNF